MRSSAPPTREGATDKSAVSPGPLAPSRELEVAKESDTERRDLQQAKKYLGIMA